MEFLRLEKSHKKHQVWNNYTYHHFYKKIPNLLARQKAYQKPSNRSRKDQNKSIEEIPQKIISRWALKTIFIQNVGFYPETGQ